jgi:Rrf2 family protein
MVSQTSRYALHILGYLVRHPGRFVRGEEIAGATGIPGNYLSKILSQLRKNGLVEARKGWGGGFAVLESALDRPIRDVLQIIEGAEVVERTDCAFGLPACDASHPCPLHGHWEKIRRTYHEMLSETRIGDLSLSR